MSTTNSALAPKEVPSFINSLGPGSFLKKAGVNILENLSYTQSIPSSSGFQLYFPGETGSTTGVTATLTLSGDAPHRVSGYVEVSRQLFLQNPELSTEWLRVEFGRALEASIERVLLAGDSNLNEPVGITNVSGIFEKTYTTSPTYDDCCALEEGLGLASQTNPATYAITHPNLAKILRKVAVDTGSGSVVLQSPWGKFLDYNYTSTTNAPSTKLILGNFNKAVVGLYGSKDLGSAVDIFIDPITGARSGKYYVHFNAYVGISIQPESFAVLKSA